MDRTKLDFRYWVYTMKTKVPMKLAWLLPRRVAYWAAIRVMAHATTGQYSNQIVPELYATDALKRWDDK